MDFEALVKHISTIQSTLQAQAAHAVNLALTARNWLMGCYIVEFEQNGEDRAAYGEQLLKKLEQRLNVKGLNERRFREFRRLYLVYPQLKEPIAQYILAGSEIRHTLSAEFTDPIRHTVSAELQSVNNQPSEWNTQADRLFERLPYSHLKFISKIENPVKRAFYEMEAIRGCWSARELERQINSLYYERSGLSKNKEALSALVQRQAMPLQPKDIINTPVTLEFLGIERPCFGNGKRLGAIHSGQPATLPVGNGTWLLLRSTPKENPDRRGLFLCRPRVLPPHFEMPCHRGIEDRQVPPRIRFATEPIS